MTMLEDPKLTSSVDTPNLHLFYRAVSPEEELRADCTASVQQEIGHAEKSKRDRKTVMKGTPPPPPDAANCSREG